MLILVTDNLSSFTLLTQSFQIYFHFQKTFATFSLSVVNEEGLDEDAAEAGDKESSRGKEGEGKEGGNHPECCCSPL